MNAAVLWSQVCRDRWGSTLQALRGRASRRSRNLLRGTGQEGAAIFRPAGDERDERRYLDEVGGLDGREPGDPPASG
jgi:hypothetical protein